MPWNVWLAQHLIEMGRWQVLSYFLVVTIGIMVLAVLTVRYCERLRNIVHNGEWAEHAAAKLLLDLHDRTAYRVTFDFRGDWESGIVRIEGKHIDFVCDCSESPVSFARSNNNSDLFELFSGHSNRPALLQLMRCMQGLAKINDTWLDYHKEKRFIEFLRSAEIVPFKRVA